MCTFEKMLKNKIINVNGPEKPEKEVPLTLFVFFSILFALGFDFGFSNFLKKNVQCVATFFCHFMSILIITAIFIQIVYKTETAQLSASTWLICGLIQYSFHVIFLHFSNYNLYNFIRDMYSLDIITKLIKNPDKVFVNRLLLFFCNSYIVRGTFCYLLCTSETNECETLYVPGHIYCILITSLNIITMVQMIIYFYIYLAVKNLNVALVNKDKDIKWARIQFTALADICDKITPTYGRLVSSYFVFHVIFHTYIYEHHAFLASG